MRTVALDVHKRFAEVAVHEDGGGLRRLGRIETGRLAGVRRVVGPDDHVVLESTAMTWAIAELLARACGSGDGVQSDAHAGDRVGEGQDRQDRRARCSRSSARRTSCRRCGRRMRQTRALRRRIAHRVEPGAAAHAVAQPDPCGARAQPDRGDVTDVFGQSGRRLVGRGRAGRARARSGRPALRLHDALDGEIERAERTLAEHALDSAQVRRLMTIPGVGAITALSIVGVIGDVDRFPARVTWSATSAWIPASGSPGRRPPSRTHLARGTGARPRAADRGRAHRDPHPRPAARLPRATQGPSRLAGRDVRDGAQARGALPGTCCPRRGLPPRGADDHPAQAAQAAAPRPTTRARGSASPARPAQGARASSPRTGRTSLPQRHRVE